MHVVSVCFITLLFHPTLFGYHGNALDKSNMLNEPRECTSVGQRRGALCHVLYNMSNSFYYLRSNHDVNTQRNFHLLACSPPKRRNYLTDLHQNFTQYSGINGTIKSCIYKALCIPFLNARATNWEFAIFSQNWLPWQHPLPNRKIHHLHPKRSHMALIMMKRLRKSVQYIWRYLTKYARFYISTCNMACHAVSSHLAAFRDKSRCGLMHPYIDSATFAQ